ncbi:uncharacterized protein J4E84_005181 [Alternaria hordeiaustralica]|uniref:uncharacterized protein n=1 Tax=Alternaria hordeiaustralica TaxID=1187925 RepID=UPI0020C49C89|nr:uncharacterized protein J4E84_005181 [Alternaria hordeiaustralica]KAI4688250.1 hypothetical protein J4E84_005181 [Alternaria hordeiaustralica]
MVNTEASSVIQDYIPSASSPSSSSPSSSSPSSSSPSTMSSPASAMQIRAENAEQENAELKRDLELANKKNEDLAAKLEATEKELAEYKQAETDRENERKKVEADKKAAHDAGVARWKDAAVSGASLGEQSQAFVGNGAPKLSLEEKSAVWLAKYGKKK